jgi:hypothetical protein
MDIDKRVGIDYPGYAALQDGQVIASARNFKVLMDKEIVKNSFGKKGFSIGYVRQKGTILTLSVEEIRANLSII